MIGNAENYKLFYYTAKNQNITAAARELYISQSTVSRGLQSLEEELGCSLMQRTKSGIRLTPEGSVLYDSVKKAFLMLEDAQEHLYEQKRLQAGTLRIGVTELTLKFFLIPYLHYFQENFPDITFKIKFIYPSNVMQMLHEGKLDIAFVSTPFSSDHEICSIRMMEYHDLLVAGRKYRYLKNRLLSFSEIQHENFIMMEKGTSAYEYLEEQMQKLHVELNIKYEMCSMPLILSMVRQNLGIGFVPSLYLDEYSEKNELYSLALETPLPARNICALTSKRIPKYPIRDTFLSHICRKEGIHF
ncbi:MAG: LysR family transcriptional regulator [Lachnospiraceae bacterium]|nr:LysR family transcriptional regulator [Lachnospiraceae bacterium]